MRRQLVLAAASVTSIVVLAFVLPLCALVGNLARDRAVTAAQREAVVLVPVVASVGDRTTLEQVVHSADAENDGNVSVFLADGTLIGAPATADANVARAAGGASFVASVDGGREILLPVVRADGTTDVVRVFVSAATLSAGVTRARVMLVLLGVALVLVSVVVADRLAKSIVAPVGELASVAHRLEQGDLDARVQPAGPPEILEVGHAQNMLAARIRELLAAEREAVADLSHRLRTPVTALRLDAENLADGAEARQLVADVDALERAVDRLINEARRPSRNGAAVANLCAVTRERVTFWGALADDQQRAFSLVLPDAEILVAVNREDLAAALDAVLDNVFAHTPDGTPFSVRVAADAATARVSVEDRGPGFDAALLERGASGGGSTGLGFDIARRTAELSGGCLAVERADRGGTRVVLELGRSH
jgi:signal transduction histidine kinase